MEMLLSKGYEENELPENPRHTTVLLAKKLLHSNKRVKKQEEKS